MLQMAPSQLSLTLTQIEWACDGCRSYQRWDLNVDFDFLRPEECIALILNAPCDRTVEEPLQIHLMLDADSDEGVEQLAEVACAKMYASGTYPHVSVTCDSRYILAEAQ